ncbi:formate C-acetyltransferase [Pseudobutyrivibrio sp. OR37]|uniref:(2S)-3-sulfopropanediol dehydratase n=1 Tax=Pseudobutyrivibrio sp. OR37 TaxID=1798186 RepID=UPI0008F1AF38|nr:pyruvate formate lyase family protein [Pseudobutyrivibrio sp. OR37]SFI13468.1 formate C-acetyltransferase [Pseudobutyrivibrio sp. OR37]
MGNVLLSPQEERLEKNNGRVELSGREKRIYDSFQKSKSVVDVQRAKYFTESFKETEGQALSLRWAKALYNIAEKIDVVIDDAQLIVGRGGKPGKYGIIYPELDGCFLKQFVKQASSRVESPFEIDEEDIKVIEEEIAPYWQGKTYYEDFAHAMPKDVLKITYDPKDLFSSRFILNESSSMRSALQWVHDYKKGIDLGFEAIKKEAEKALDNLDEYDPRDTVDKAEFYESIIIVSDAIILWAKRHGDEALRLAELEADETRKKELLEISRICYKVPAKPAETFHEALQSQWFIQMFSRLEQKTGATISNGRMDQYLYPYYKKDLAEGRITPAKAKELFRCVWLAMAQYQDLFVSPAGVKFHEGYAHWEAVTIGGVDENGYDATNDLSYLLLEDKREFPLNYPDLAARIHSGSPERFLREIATTIKDGSGFPKLINDEEIIPILVSKGADFESANDYAVSGCTEVRMPNLDTFTTPCPFINLAAILELTLYNGRMPKYGEELLTIETGDVKQFKTYQDLEDAFVEQEKYLLKQALRQQFVANRTRPKHFASPLGSSLHKLCMKAGKDLHSETIEGGFDAGFFDFIGFGTVADSLAAIKKCVYDDKTISWEELIQALNNNFEGAEAIRQRLLNSPKYGNDDEYVDSIAKRIDKEAVSFVNKYAKNIGIYMDLRYVSQSVNVPFGTVVGATPNGRFAGTALSDGSSASQGADEHGPTAVLLSNYKTKNTNYNNRAARLLNIKLTPASVAGDIGTRKLVQFIKSWRDLKLWHLQFNIINKETLLDAQAHPENYRSLLVRVAGYSAYFVELSRNLQNDVVNRTAHDEIA